MIYKRPHRANTIKPVHNDSTSMRNIKERKKTQIYKIDIDASTHTKITSKQPLPTLKIPPHLHLPNPLHLTPNKIPPSLQQHIWPQYPLQPKTPPDKRKQLPLNLSRMPRQPMIITRKQPYLPIPTRPIRLEQTLRARRRKNFILLPVEKK